MGLGECLTTLVTLISLISALLSILGSKNILIPLFNTGNKEIVVVDGKAVDTTNNEENRIELISFGGVGLSSSTFLNYGVTVSTGLTFPSDIENTPCILFASSHSTSQSLEKETFEPEAIAALIAKADIDPKEYSPIELAYKLDAYMKSICNDYAFVWSTDEIFLHGYTSNFIKEYMKLPFFVISGTIDNKVAVDINSLYISFGIISAKVVGVDINNLSPATASIILFSFIFSAALSMAVVTKLIAKRELQEELAKYVYLSTLYTTLPIIFSGVFILTEINHEPESPAGFSAEVVMICLAILSLRSLYIYYSDRIANNKRLFPAIILSVISINVFITLVAAPISMIAILLDDHMALLV